MEIGTVEGAVNTEQFHFEAHKDVEKFDFVTVRANTDEAEWLLAQIDSVEKKPLDDSEKTDSAYKTVANANIIGYRSKGLLKKPRSVIEPDSIVYGADQDVISDVLGLDQDGLFMGSLMTDPDISIYLDPEELYKHIAVLAKTGAGKCVSGDTEVLRADGSLTEIRELFEEHGAQTVRSTDDEELVVLDDVQVQTLRPDLSTGRSRALFGYRKQADQVVEIRTASGREITTSLEHPLLTGDTEFRQAQDLEEGDRIGIPDRIESEPAPPAVRDDLLQVSADLRDQRSSRAADHRLAVQRADDGESAAAIASDIDTAQGTVEGWIYDGHAPAATGAETFVTSETGKAVGVPDMGPEMAEFLALLIAEGTEQRTSHYRTIFTNSDERLLDRFTTLADELFGLETSVMRDDTVYIDSNALQEVLEAFGHRTDMRSAGKTIPDSVLQASRDAKRRFLRTYADCEGCMEDHAVTIATASRDIADRLLYLLLEFGIVARRHTTVKEATNSDHDGDTYHVVTISGHNDLRRFQDRIGFGMERKQQRLERYLEDTEANTNTDTFDIDGDRLRQEREAAGLSQRELAETIGMSQMIISRYEMEERRPSRTALRRLGETLGIDEYLRLADAAVRWDEIVAIETVENPDEYVYDLTVARDHTFIAGGGGIINHNSYATGVLVEELLEKDYPVVVIDPHGEYDSLAVPNDELDDESRDKYGLEEKGYPVRSFSPNTDLNSQAEELTFSSRNLSAKEIQQIVPTNLTNSQLGVLYTALRELKKRDSYDLDDLIETCTEQDSKAKWNLINMLETVQDSGMYAPDPTEIEALLEPGRATVVNLRGVDPEQQELTVYMLAKEMFEMRKRGELQPFIMIFEEAHNFVPEKGMGKAACSDILRKIASEGRKFGLGIGVISQRPANVAKNILSQCNTQLIMRVTNPNDLSAISRSFEGVTSEVEDSITSLPPGTGLILGKEYPIMTDIRTRRSKHGGTTKDVSEEEGIDKGPEARRDSGPAPVDDGDTAAGEDGGADGSSLRRPATGTAGDTDADTDEDERQPVDSFEPEMGLEEAERRFDDVRRALYPIYIVETNVGSLAIDATDGSVKDRQLNLTKQADAVLDAVREQRMTVTELSEYCRIEKETVETIVDRLLEYGLVEEHNGSYRKAGSGVLQRKIIELDAARSKVIEPKFGEDRAAAITDEQLGAEIEEIRMVYYPYYTSGDRVFDAVLGKEV